MRRFISILFLIAVPFLAPGRDYYAEAEALYFAGKFPEAVSVALEGCSQPGLTADQAVELHSILGSSYARLGAFDKAADYMVRCYEYDRANGEAEGLTSSLINLASMYVYAGSPELAEQYALEAIFNEERVGRPAKLAMALGKACDVYHALGQDSTAVLYADRAVAIARQQKDTRDEAVRRSQRAYALESLGRYGEALADLRFAEQVFRENESLQSLSVVCFQLAQEYGRQGRNTLERQYLREAADLAREMQDLPLLQKVCARLATALRPSDPAGAFEFLQEASALQDSINKSKSDHVLELYNIEYETARREETIQRQEQELRRQRRWRNTLIIALLLLLAGAVSTTVSALRARRDERNLRQSNAQKAFLLKVISHDIHSPAVARLKGLQMLRGSAGKLSGDELREVFLQMEQQAASDVELIDNVLRWARAGELRSEPVRFDLRDLASEVLAQFRQPASLKDISLVLEAPESVVVRTDRSSLMLALRNLLSNAIKYSHPGGEVRLSVVPGKLCVRDNGIGIPADKQESIFQPADGFRRAGTAGELSNGLGLAVSRKLVELLGGSLSVESREGEGSVFTIQIPPADA
ncbi:MAG: HAMP domain-containing histidine kinase [Bacteroidales bacterium]|nr:HAMP domain-containing histidine kinase [Bacteroidales bacterium]